MGDEQAFPVSFAQQRLWVLDRLSPGTPQYNLANAVQFSEPIDPRVLARAVREIIGRHESLRTTFRSIDGQPVQVVRSDGEAALAIVDLRGRAEAARPAQAVGIIRDEVRRAFDLTRGPLLRIALLRLAEREQILVVTMHHIVSDGWSIGVFFRELTALYQALARGEPSPLPDLPIQYVDYALWQRAWLADGRLARQMEYWRRQLAGLPLLELPTDHPRPAEATFRGARRPFAVPAPVAERLRALCRQEDATLFMVLLGVFQMLLHRYSGQDDVVVGMPVAGRDRPEVADLIGFFVNTLVLRLDLAGNPTFRELLRRVKAMALAAYEHQDVPFEKLVEELKPERDPSRNPFFQVTFQLLQLPSGGGALSARSLDVDGGTAGFDLSFDLWEEPAGLGGRIEHSTDLFETATIERMASHFCALLDRLSAEPDLRLGEIGLATADESRMLRAWNDTEAGSGDLPFVHQLFARQAALAPEAIALVDGAESLTYRELEERARQVARRLRASGVGPEALVALDLPRSLELIAAMLGVLAAGGAYLPLDTTWPRERTAAMLADAKPRVVLSALEGGRDRTDQSDRSDPSDLSPENLAYVIYTSGSTGLPNGCLISHGALANHCAAIVDHYGLQAMDRVLQFASPAFDVAAEEIFPTLASGATLCLPPADLSFPRFMDFLAEARVTVVNLPAGFWHAWVSYLAETGTCLPDSLRLVVAGSAPVSAQQMALWRRLASPHVRVCNAYGVSEAAITTTIHDVPLDGPDPRTASVPIGRPIANTQAYVLDTYRQPVPPGLPGELYIGGAGLARGYLGRSELTAERFVLHSFDGIWAVRLYRTGDRARHLPDGTLECLGRVDEQISLRGFRIEPEEVEAALAAHPAVARAAVVAPGDGEKQLVAHVVLRQGGHVTARELRAFAGDRLPRYMVPSVFVVASELPLTPSGKVDRRALRAAGVPRQPEGDGAAPTTPEEELLATIWKEILGLDCVGVHDNFFELGGDSILSIRIMSRANQAGLRLNPMQIFQHQTIAELAAVAGSRPVPEPERTIGDGPFNLTPIQQWFFDQDLPAPHHYNQSVLLDLPREIDTAALERALGALIDHHDALRLSFDRGDGGWRQRYRQAGQPLSLESHAASLQASLDLADGPLMRAALFREPEACRLLIVIHHLATDGVSWHILLEDLWTSYRQAAAGEPIRLPEKTASFQQWAVRLRDLAHSGVLRTQLDFYLSQPYEPLLDLPVDFPEGENTVGSEATVSIALSREETQALLRDAPRTYHTEINDLLLTALALALAEWSGASAHLVDLEGHGREPLFADVDVSRTVGWFTSIRPVLLDPGPAPEPVASLKRIKEQLRAVPHHGIGHGLLRYLSGDEAVMRSLAACPKAQISFNYMGQFEAKGSAERMDCGPTRDPRQPRGYLLELNGHVSEGRLKLDWTFSRNLHTAATLTKVARRFRSGLEALVHGSAAGSVFTPSDFPLANVNQSQLDKLMRKLQR